MYILHPRYKKKVVLDESIKGVKNRVKEINKRILKGDVLNFCLNNMIIKNKRQINCYYTMEYILENCATYLLLGKFKKHNITSWYKLKQIKEREIPASCENGNAYDFIYGATNNANEDKMRLTVSNDNIPDSIIPKDDHQKSVDEIKQEKIKLEKLRKKYLKSKVHKMEQLHSTKPIYTYRIKQQYEKDQHDNFVLDPSGNKIPLKNIWGQPIFDAEYITIGGHKGIIPLDKNYKFKWATVNTDNEFEFLGNQYIIDKSVKQYEVKDDNKCEMDKILCYYIPNEDKYYFFDMNIDQIDNKLIKQV